MSATEPLGLRIHRRCAALMSMAIKAEVPYKGGVRLIVEAPEFFEQGAEAILRQPASLFQVLDGVCRNQKVIMLIVESLDHLARTTVADKVSMKREPGLYGLALQGASRLGSFESILEEIFGRKGTNPFHKSA